MKKVLPALTAILLTMWVTVAMAEPQGAKRVALIVGNASYASFGKLDNPSNDAEDVASVLRQIGFTVIEGRDLSKRDMDRHLAQFSRAASDADTAIVYYAGHGLQYQNQNFLVPTDAQLKDGFDIPFETISVDSVIGALDNARGARIMILDACRNLPLTEGVKRSSGTGLARLTGRQGLIIAYATQSNQVAYDGTGRNSPYAEALTKTLGESGLEVGQVFQKVALSVKKSTQGKQLPEFSRSYADEVFINRAETDVQAWTRLRGSNVATDFNAFIEKFPTSFLADAARIQIQMLENKARYAEQELENKRQEERRAQELLLWTRRQEEQHRRDQARLDAEKARREEEQHQAEQAKLLAQKEADEAKRQALRREEAARQEQARIAAEKAARQAAVEIMRREEVARQEQARLTELARQEAARVAAAQVEAEKVARIATAEQKRREEAARQEQVRLAEAARQEAARIEVARLETEKAVQVAATERKRREEATRQEQIRLAELARREAAQVEAARLETEKAARLAAAEQKRREEAARVEQARLAELARLEAAQVEAARLEAEKTARQAAAEQRRREEVARVEQARLAEIARLETLRAEAIKAAQLAVAEKKQREEAARAEQAHLAEIARQDAARAEAARLEQARIDAETAAQVAAIDRIRRDEVAIETARLKAESLVKDKAAEQKTGAFAHSPEIAKIIARDETAAASTDNAAHGTASLPQTSYASLDLKSAAEPKQAEAKATGTAAQSDLTHAVQRRLYDLGCFIEPMESSWGRHSATALESFYKAAQRGDQAKNGMNRSIRIATILPDQMTLDDLNSYSGRICPIACPAGSEARGDACVIVACPSGMSLRNGVCRTEKLPAEAVTPKRKPQASHPAETVKAPEPRPAPKAVRAPEPVRAPKVVSRPAPKVVDRPAAKPTFRVVQPMRASPRVPALSNSASAAPARATASSSSYGSPAEIGAVRAMSRMP